MFQVLEEMFPQYYMHGTIYSMFKLPAIHGKIVNKSSTVKEAVYVIILLALSLELIEL